MAKDYREKYKSWQAGSKREIPIKDLVVRADNWSLCGKLDDDARKELAEEIKHGGLREDLHVWVKSDKIEIVSGAERYLICKRLGYTHLRCDRKEFKSEPEARQHMVAVNMGKVVHLSPVEKLLGFYPYTEFELLYKDLRGNYAFEEVSRTAVRFTTEQQKEAKRIRAKQRVQQGKMRMEVAERMRWTKHTTERMIQKAVKILFPPDKKGLRELSERELDAGKAAFKEFKTLAKQYERGLRNLNKTRSQLSQRRNYLRKLQWGERHGIEL